MFSYNETHRFISIDRATEYKRETGEWNIGQLARERFGLENTFNIGFTTYSGTVSAAASWGDERKTFELNPAFEDSYEWLFHQIGDGKDWCLIFRRNDAKKKPDPALINALKQQRTERMVGVQYVKWRERSAHYVPCCITEVSYLFASLELTLIF
jgi:erythromycin esterase-like protein